MEPIKSSELITNDDGSVFHLHLHPEDLAKQVILVGDPSRVEMIASYFEKIEVRKSDREFCTITGYYKGHRLSVISTGIGADNIDIVMNELDALVNINLHTKEINAEKKTLNIHEFLERFEKEYDFIYDHDDNVAGVREATAAFDEFLKTHKDFVGEFVRFRGDFISSDREAAAFMFALENMGGLD